MPTFYISRNALTRGIQIVEAPDPLTEMLVVGQLGGRKFYKPGDWHRTYQDAKEKAEAMREKRVASLQRRLKGLEKLKF